MNAKIFQALFYGVRVFNPDIKVSATVPLAQAIIESANWKSPLYESANNMFGMTQPAARQTKSSGPNAKGYATFRSPLDSIRDYFDWLRAFDLKTDEALIARIKSGKYAVGDPAYFSKIQKVVASSAGDIVSPVTLGLGAVGALGLTAAAFKILADK